MILLPLLTTVAGITTLYVSWRRGATWTLVLVPAGWLLVGASVVLWMRPAGPELGVAYATMAVAFAAWAVVAAAGVEARRPGSRRPQARRDAGKPGWRGVSQAVARTVVAVPLAGAASLLASVSIVAGLPWTAANRYALAIMIAPVAWGVLAMWVGLTTRLRRATLVLLGVSAACSALLFVR